MQPKGSANHRIDRALGSNENFFANRSFLENSEIDMGASMIEMNEFEVGEIEEILGCNIEAISSMLREEKLKEVMQE